jgi:DNA modification methylase
MVKPYFETENGKLYHGDCLEVMKGITDNIFDAVITDPPYFLPATHYNVRSGSYRSLSDLSILEHFYSNVFCEIRRVLKPTGFIYMFCDGQSYPIFYAVAYPHFKRIQPLIWDKLISFNGYNWRHQHEMILFGVSDESPNIKTGDGDILKCRAVNIDERKHLAQKPIELLLKLIEKIGVKKGIVLDPFAGTASTAIACEKAKQKWHCIEKDLNYCQKAAKRIRAESRQLTIT